MKHLTIIIALSLPLLFSACGGEAKPSLVGVWQSESTDGGSDRLNGVLSLKRDGTAALGTNRPPKGTKLEKIWEVEAGTLSVKDGKYVAGREFSIVSISETHLVLADISQQKHRFVRVGE